MSDVFFSQLSMPALDVNLGVGSASHAQQTAEIMRRLEAIILERKPDMVVIYRDVGQAPHSSPSMATICSSLIDRAHDSSSGPPAQRRSQVD
jgi:UDP-N-acetylglucosamine 2-epimerase (non-hydrolysing)